MASNADGAVARLQGIGLPADPAGIATFIQRHSPLSADVLLAEARQADEILLDAGVRS